MAAPAERTLYQYTHESETEEVNHRKEGRKNDNNCSDLTVDPQCHQYELHNLPWTSGNGGNAENNGPRDPGTKFQVLLFK